jgi:Ca2+-binding EF-hand superfamily protein
MLRKILVSAVIVSMTAGTVALAQDAEDEAPAAAERVERRGPNAMFSRLDTDGDGTISAEEFAAARLDRLRAADTDGDGVLSQEELVQYVMQREFERRAQRLARALDVTGDGTVSLADLEDHHGKLFALMDRNNDGVLSAEEMRRGSFGQRMHMRRMGEDGPRFARWRGDGPRHHKFMHRMERMQPAAPADEAPAEE